MFLIAKNINHGVFTLGAGTLRLEGTVGGGGLSDPEGLAIGVD